MLYVKSFHIIAIVAWFSGLFYLPRLFVYHAEALDNISDARFKIMERRLYYGITWPAAIIASFLGIWLISYHPNYYLTAGWMHFKLLLVILLWGYHILCGHYLHLFASNLNRKTTKFYRFFNEIPLFFLIGIVLLVVVRP